MIDPPGPMDTANTRSETQKTAACSDSDDKPTFFIENCSENTNNNQGEENALTSCDVTVTSCDVTSGDVIAIASDEISENGSNCGITPNKPGVQHGKGDLNFSLHTAYETNQESVVDVNDEDVVDCGSTDGISAKTNTEISTEKQSKNPVEQPQPQQLLQPLVQPPTVEELRRNVSLLNLDTKDKGDYIFQAANQISLGQQCEANNNYQMAFNYFRTGVGILLTGVQRMSVYFCL